MGFIQTCLRQIYPALRAQQGVHCTWWCWVWGHPGVRFCKSRAPLGKPKTRVPQGVKHRVTPKGITTEGAEESAHSHKGPTWARGLGSVCKAFTAIISLTLASWGVVPRLLWAEYLCLQAAHAGIKKQNHQVRACPPNYPGTKLMAQEN